MKTKLLNEDGSFNRWIYPSELADLQKSGVVARIKSRNISVVRLKRMPEPSDSATSPCMPTLGDVLSYVGLRKCTDEQRAKIEACRPHMVASPVICSLSGDSYKTLEQELAAQEAEVFRLHGGYQSLGPEIAA